MGRLSDCRICSDPRRIRLEAARGQGASYADLARTYGVPATTIRRHIREHVRPKARPAAPRRSPKPPAPIPELPLSTLREIGALIPRPFPLVAHVISGCLNINVLGADDAENEAIWELFDEGEAMAEALKAPLRPVRASEL